VIPAAALLAVALASAPGSSTSIRPAPLRLWSIAWERKLVSPVFLEWSPVEPAAPAVDPATGIVVAGTRDGWLRALRPDGSTVWDFRGDGPFDGSPRIDGDTVYVGASDGRLYAIALATGKERWRYDAKEELATRPAVADGTVYVASLQDAIFAIDARTGAWKWQYRHERKEGGFTIRGAASAIVDGGAVFAGFSDGSVTALDPATGAVRWDRRVAPKGQFLDVDSIQVEGGRVFAAAYSGAVVALDQKTGATVWEFPTKYASRVAAFPGTIVGLSASAVFALSAQDGTVLWSTPLGGIPRSAPIRAGAWLLVPSGSGGLRALEVASGRLLRVLETGSGVSASPAVLGRRAYVISNGGDLYALDLE
jgi:outer membrane protein assembly factor BamB